MILIGSPQRLAKIHSFELSSGLCSLAQCHAKHFFTQKTAATATCHIRSLVVYRYYMPRNLIQKVTA